MHARDLGGVGLAAGLLAAAATASAGWAIFVLAGGAGLCTGLVGWDVWRGVRARSGVAPWRPSMGPTGVWTSVLGRDEPAPHDVAPSPTALATRTTVAVELAPAPRAAPAELGPAELGPAEMGAAEMGPAEMGPPGAATLAVSIAREELRPFGEGMLLVGVELTVHNPTDRFEFLGPVTWIPTQGGLGDTGAPDVRQWLGELERDHPSLPGHVDPRMTVVGWQWAVIVDAPDPHAPDYRVTVEDGSGRVYEPSLPPPPPSSTGPT